MPTYEYACGKCGHEFEREQRITEDPVKTCPECRSRKVERLISATSFVLKGGGWYSDLYASNKPGKKSEGGDSDGGDKGDAKKGGDKAAKADKSETKTPKKKGKQSSS